MNAGGVGVYCQPANCNQLQELSKSFLLDTECQGFNGSTWVPQSHPVAGRPSPVPGITASLLPDNHVSTIQRSSGVKGGKYRRRAQDTHIANKMDDVNRGEVCTRRITIAPRCYERINRYTLHSLVTRRCRLQNGASMNLYRKVLGPVPGTCFCLRCRAVGREPVDPLIQRRRQVIVR